MLEHGKAIKVETESREVRENRVRESNGRNSIELRTPKSISSEKGSPSGVGLTRGSLLYQLANRETTKNDATRNDSPRVDSLTMLSQELGSTRWLDSVGCTETRSKCAVRICIPHALTSVFMQVRIMPSPSSIAT